MYFQLGRVRMYTDFRVWRNNYGILATNVNPVTVLLSGAVTAGDNQCHRILGPPFVWAPQPHLPGKMGLPDPILPVQWGPLGPILPER